MNTFAQHRQRAASRCVLCLEVRFLRKSHILPAFLYRPLINDQQHMMSIRPNVPNGWRRLYSGIYDRLLCDECEQFLSVRYEQPFKRMWVDTAPFPARCHPEDEYTGQFAYSAFKLFHLSYLLRLSASDQLLCSKISLGKHHDTVRRMVLTGDPGTPEEFPMIGYLCVNRRDNGVVQFVSQPTWFRSDGHWCVRALFGGAAWFYSVGSHRHREYEACGLKADGAMPFIAKTIDEFVEFQLAAEVFRGARRSPAV